MDCIFNVRTRSFLCERIYTGNLKHTKTIINTDITTQTVFSNLLNQCFFFFSRQQHSLFLLHQLFWGEKPLTIDEKNHSCQHTKLQLERCHLDKIRENKFLLIVVIPARCKLYVHIISVLFFDYFRFKTKGTQGGVISAVWKTRWSTAQWLQGSGMWQCYTLTRYEGKCVTRSDKPRTKCQFGHSELLIPAESAIKELLFDAKFKSVHNAKVKPLKVRW